MIRQKKTYEKWRKVIYLIIIMARTFNTLIFASSNIASLRNQILIGILAKKN